jgi:hypothetical protein
MEKEEVFQRIDDYLDYAVKPMNKSQIKLDKHNAIDADAIRTLKHYKLIVYRYPLDENSSIIDITVAGTEVKAAGGIKKYIDLIESKHNASAISSSVGHSGLSHKLNSNSNKRSTNKKSTFVKFEKSSGPGLTYLIIGFVLALVLAYKVLHEMHLINF